MATRLVSVVIPSLIAVISTLGAAGCPVDYQQKHSLIIRKYFRSVIGQHNPIGQHSPLWILYWQFTALAIACCCIQHSDCPNHTCTFLLLCKQSSKLGPLSNGKGTLLDLGLGLDIYSTLY